MIQQGYRPLWTRELLTLYDGRIARQFVIHFNITDFVVDLSDQRRAQELGHDVLAPSGIVVGDARPFREYLHGFLRQELHCQAIYTYSLALGLLADEDAEIDTPLNAEVHGRLWQHVARAATAVRATPKRAAVQRTAAGQPQEGREVDLPEDVPSNLRILGHMLRQRYNVSGDEWRQGDVEAPIAVILDYAEKLIPYRLGEGHGDREQLQALETVQRWALDPRLRATQNIVILLTNNIGQIAPGVFAEGSGCREIRVPLPDRAARQAFIEWRMSRNQFVRLDQAQYGMQTSEQAVQLALQTQGMRLADIDNLSRRVIVERRTRRLPEVMEKKDVQHEKGKVIQAQSENLLEIVTPRRSFAEIGGLENLQKYLKVRTGQMGSGTPLVPSGLLLAGPPGTGKTIIAEALATESGFNLVKMRNIREKWVGSSERNLDLALNLLKDLNPVVVFVDEIDQAMGQRDTGQNADSGVGARMFGRILEVMSDANNRGKILWVAATNRADLLDDALLRRFDRVVPLLVPDEREACLIFERMPTMIAKQTDGSYNIYYSQELATVPSDPNRFRAVASQAVYQGLTGAGIEIVVRRAVELACEAAVRNNMALANAVLPPITETHLLDAMRDYKPNHNTSAYDFQSLVAIRACNFYSVLPNLPDREPFRRIRGAHGHIDPAKLDEEINRLKAELKL